MCCVLREITKKADKLRAEIENMGYVVEDDGDVSRVRKMLR